MATEHAKQVKPSSAQKFMWSGKTAAPAAVVVPSALPLAAGLDLSKVGKLILAWSAASQIERAPVAQQ